MFEALTSRLPYRLISYRSYSSKASAVAEPIICAFAGEKKSGCDPYSYRSDQFLNHIPTYFIRSQPKILEWSISHKPSFNSKSYTSLG
ncbi:MAG: hypothetical protein K0S23_2711 [Fluviicola sp.]|nr:hypothetical protein [Fluviicola sp.]